MHPPATLIDGGLLALFSFEGNLDAYLSRVTTFSLDAFGADGASLFLRIDGSDTFVVAASAGASDIPWTASFRMGDGLAGSAAARAEPTLVHGGVGSRNDLQSAMIVPLVAASGDVVGVLNLSRQIGSERFTEADLPTAQAMTRYLALAVANAGLVSRLGAAADRNASLAAEFSGVLNSLSSAVIALDASGRIVQANLRAKDMLGSGGATISAWIDLAASLSPESFAELNRAILCALNGQSRRTQFTEPAGSHYSAHAVPAANGGVTLVIDDVTEQVDRDRELGRARRLAEIGQMAAAVAHEIRNPLTSIRGAAQMIRSEDAMEAAQTWASVIEDEAIELEGLCEDFLELSRDLSLTRSDSDLNSVTDRVLTQMEPEILASGVVLCFTRDPAQPIISMDTARVGQALRNLIRNAVDAMPGGGTLEVTVRHDERTGGIEVKDTGHGISEQDLGRLFTPFFTTKSRGTGLGLCNVRRIAEAHGGTVRATSVFGAGTSFTLELPIKVPA